MQAHKKDLLTSRRWLFRLCRTDCDSLWASQHSSASQLVSVHEDHDLS